MTLNATLVPYGHLTAVLGAPSFMSLLHKSELWSRGRSSIDDIVAFLYSGQMKLWISYEADPWVVRGYVITEEREYPRCKMLVCQYCAAEDHSMLAVRDQMFTLLEQYGRDAGCAGVEFFGRPGWGAYVKKLGYDVQTVVYEKYFNGDPL